MKILMVANYVNFPWETGNCRFMYLLNLLCDKHDVELVTTDFYHNTKKHRTITKKQRESLNFKITLIHEKGYKKNVSLQRFFSHYKLSKSLKKYLNSLDYKLDVIYCSVPSLDVAKETAKYAKKNGIKFIIDVQDLWPEAFKMVFHLPVISDLIFYPMKKEADFIYSCADEIIAVSETYAKRALSVNRKCKEGHSVFLGTDLEYFDNCKKENEMNYEDDLIRIAYIGTLGHSYDIRCVIDSIQLLNQKGIKNIKFIVMGDGPLKESFEMYAQEKQVDCDFTGRLDYPKMVGLLCSCDIAVNPISHGAAQSIINKVGDYAAAGLPVVSTQECPEYRNILEKYDAGLNCENGNINDIADKLESLITDEKLRIKLGKGNRKLAEEKFDREETYNQIINIINRSKHEKSK